MTIVFDGSMLSNRRKIAFNLRQHVFFFVQMITIFTKQKYLNALFAKTAEKNLSSANSWCDTYTVRTQGKIVRGKVMLGKLCPTLVNQRWVGQKSFYPTVE